jgi:ATP-dependent DNA helicase RecG
MKDMVFISSVQKELAPERAAIRDYLAADPLLRRHFRACLFEDAPAKDRPAESLYLGELDRADVYVALLGQDYGSEDADGLSPTEREFNRATERGIPRLVFVKGAADNARHPKMRALIAKASGQLVRRRFADIPSLKEALYVSLVDYLESQGVIQNRPFEERTCPDAGLADLDPEAVTGFVRQACAERQFPLTEQAGIQEVLTHLGLLSDNRLCNAAILLFGRQPQRFIPCAEARCMHFHGTEIERPAPFYRVFKGNLFEQVDRATDFVLSVIRQGIGTRENSAQAPAPYEIPRDVVREAVVNAVVHRDYTANAAVQVSVFADRLEVRNPGHLLPPLTPESLRGPHPSVLRNPRIAEALFLARYIEKYGTGTLMMIRESREHALPEPGFQQQASEFATTVWRDWLTEEVMARLGLNERQRQAVSLVQKHGRVTNRDVKVAAGVADRTVLRDLDDLVAKRVLKRRGTTGRSAYYVLRQETRHKPDKPDIPQTRHKPDKPVMPRPTAGNKAAPAAGAKGITMRSNGSRPANLTTNAPIAPSSGTSRVSRRTGSDPGRLVKRASKGHKGKYN